jgi:hypothetical protein
MRATRRSLRYLAGEIDLDSFISHRISLEEVNRGFELMHHRDGIRFVIRYLRTLRDPVAATRRSAAAVGRRSG